MNTNSREAILAAATLSAQAHGYLGMNFRDLAAEVGIKAASIYHHFPSKAELGAAVARRYWEDAATVLEAISDEALSPVEALRRYPATFRLALTNGNRICLCSFMAAEFDDLPDIMKTEVLAFADVNVAWLTRHVSAAGLTTAGDSEARARSIYAAIAGAQLVARSRSDISIYDALIDGYRTAGLLPR
ncbi:TetR/AcrR family transcriptional regulator [Methylopila henanensis]|uniref:TetR/AcrR family transcriptional regulator n=1 Tax=Methylopila henanensis TaxID=873516 RepID=A0ABW4K671_9HYPH